MNVISSLPPPPPLPLKPIPSSSFKPTLKKAHTLETSPTVNIAKSCRSRHHSRSKSKQRDSSLNRQEPINVTSSLTQFSSHTIIAKPEELESMISQLIDLKLKQNASTLTLTPEKVPPVTTPIKNNKNTDSISTQTKITHKRFYSPEKLPEFYKNNINDSKFDKSNNKTSTPPPHPPLQSQQSSLRSTNRHSRSDVTNLNDEQAKKLVTRETQTTGKLIQLKPPQTQSKTNKNEVEPAASTSASLNVLNELNSKFNNDATSSIRVKSNSVDTRYFPENF
jgi:hypothetical protein